MELICALPLSWLLKTINCIMWCVTEHNEKLLGIRNIVDRGPAFSMKHYQVEKSYCMRKEIRYEMKWIQVEFSPTTSDQSNQILDQSLDLPVRPTLKDIQDKGLGDEHGSTDFEGKYEEAMIVQEMWIRWYEIFAPLFRKTVKDIITAKASKQDLWNTEKILEGLPPIPNIIHESTPAIEETYGGVWQLKVYVDWVYWAQKAENAYEAIYAQLAKLSSTKMSCSEGREMRIEDDLGMSNLRLRDREILDGEELMARMHELLPPRLDIMGANFGDREGDSEDCMWSMGMRMKGLPI